MSAKSPVVRTPTHGDLYIHDAGQRSPVVVKIDKAERASAAEEAAAALGRAALSKAPPECPWCGHKSVDEAAFKEHIVALHADVFRDATEQARDAMQAAGQRAGAQLAGAGAAAGAAAVKK